MASSWVLFAALACCGIVAVLCKCPPGWTEHNGECLMFSPHTKAFSDAELDCRRHSAYLVTDDTMDKHEFIELFVNIFNSWHMRHFWVGGSDFAIENQWRWIETGVSMGSRTFWDKGQPDGNNSANCLSIGMNASNSLVWRDDRCQHNYNYICEQQAIDDTSTPVVIG